MTARLIDGLTAHYKYDQRRILRWLAFLVRFCSAIFIDINLSIWQRVGPLPSLLLLFTVVFVEAAVAGDICFTLRDELRQRMEERADPASLLEAPNAP